MLGKSICVFVACAALGSSGRCASPSNVDSGIGDWQCIESGSLRLVACASSDLPGQDAELGRDADPDQNGSGDGRLGFSFTKMCNNGQRAGIKKCPADPPLGDGPLEWGCTVDNLTGMVWEVKTRSGMRSMDLRYTNYSREYDPVGGFGSATDATGYINRVNAQGLCGANDWGLGHSGKLQLVLDYGGKRKSRLDPKYFPNSLAEPYWNSSHNPSRIDTAWTVDFATGVIDNLAHRSELHPVRLVRGKPAFGPGNDPSYTYSADGSEVTQKLRGGNVTFRRCVEGLTWNGSACVGTPGTFTLDDAFRHAAAVSADTGVAWHVPNVKELNTIVRRERIGPAVDRDVFPQTPASAHCTSTPDIADGSLAWNVDFDIGRVFSEARSKLCILRLVR